MAYAVRALSKRLEVNEAGTKVRRIAPLPETDETSPSRTVVAIGLTPEKATIESVAEMFSHGGTSGIALIRILRPGSTIPPDVRQCANRHPDILTSVSAVVEFEQADNARRALNEAFSLPDGIRLVELASRRGSNKNSPASSRPVTPQPPSSEASTPNTNRRNKRRTGPTQQKSADEESAPRSPFLRRQDLIYINSSNQSTPSHSPQPRRHMQPNSSLAARPSGQQSPMTRPKSASYSEQPTTTAVSLSSSPSHSPWVRRRLGLGLDSGRSSPLPGSSADNRLSVPSNIVRMPNGPDGTRGFHFGAGKPRSASAPEAPLTVI